MTREDVVTTPIFDQLLREMAQHAEPQAPPAEPEGTDAQAEQARPNPRRRHRAE